MTRVSLIKIMQMNEVVDQFLDSQIMTELDAIRKKIVEEHGLELAKFDRTLKKMVIDNQ